MFKTHGEAKRALDTFGPEGKTKAHFILEDGAHLTVSPNGSDGVQFDLESPKGNSRRTYIYHVSRAVVILAGMLAPAPTQGDTECRK